MRPAMRMRLSELVQLGGAGRVSRAGEDDGFESSEKVSVESEAQGGVELGG